MKRNNESNKQVDTSNADPNGSSSTKVTSLSNAPVATTTSNGYTGFFTFTQPRRRGGKRKIPIEYIKDKTRRQITFSKRKAGIMKKAYELGHLTGSEVMVLVVSETNQVYTFATEKFQQYFTHPEAKLLLHQCIHSPESLNATNPEPNLILPSASASNSSSSAPESSASSSVVQSPAPAALNEELDLDAEEEEPDEQDEE